MAGSVTMNIFEVNKARESAKKIINNAKEIQKAYTKLQSALNSVSWWKGDSKRGFEKRANRLLEAVNATASNALRLGNDLLEVAKQKEEEEHGLRNAISGQQLNVTTITASEGGYK